MKMKLVSRLLASAALVFWPVAGEAQLLLRGVGSAPTAGAQFVPSAFLLTQEASAKLATGLTNSPYFDLNFDFKCTQGVNGGTPPDRYQSCYNEVLTGNWSNTPCSNLSSAETMPGLNIVWEQGENGGLIRVNVNNANCPGGLLGAPNNNNSANAAYGPSPATDVFDGAWHHFRAWGDVSQSCNGGTARCGGMSIDGTQLIFGLPDVGSGGWTGPKIVAFGSAPWFVDAFENTDPKQPAGKLQVANYALDTSVSPVGSATNTPTNPDSKFTNGGLPVDYGTNCATAYGHQPTLCHRGPDFLVDTGSLATNFTIAQNVANSITGQVYLAPSAPSETTTTPTVRWNHDTKWNPLCANTTLTCAVSNLNQGNPIVLGDELCAFVDVSFSGSTGNDAFTASGYTTKIATINANSMNHWVGCKTAGAGDVTSPGAAWAGPTWTWLNNGSSFSLANITIVDFAPKSGGTTPNVSDAQSASEANGSLPYPNCTAPSGASLWFGHITTYDWEFSVGWSGGPPSTAQLLGKMAGVPAGNAAIMAWEKLAASGTVSRTGQESGSLGNPTIATCMVLN